MSIDIYNIKWKNISDNLTPYFWRDIRLFTPDTKAPFNWLPNYIYAVLIPLENLTNRLFELAFVGENRLKYTGQVEVLNISLNDYFDSFLRRIFISDPIQAENNNYSIYTQPEINPDFFSLYTVGETNPNPITFYIGAAQDYNFIVNVPAGLSYDNDQMRALIDTYRLAGKKYNIVTF